MSFSLQVSGHAGNGMAATDDDEGEAVKGLITRLLIDADSVDLQVSVHTVSPTKWAPEKLVSWPTNK